MEIIHYHFKTLPSTNDWGKDHIQEFSPQHLTLVSSDAQTEGRGRYGKRWLAPEGLNIYASFCFFIDENQRDPLSLTHLMAISAIRVLEERGIRCQIKWPNDVMVNHKKISGILCETIPLDNRFGVVIGIGLNVNMTKDLLQTIDQPATSILAETGNETVVGEVIHALKTYFSKDLSIFLKEGFAPFLPTFRQLILPGARDIQLRSPS